MHGTKRSEIEHTLSNDQHAHEHDGDLGASHELRAREARSDVTADEALDRTIELREEELLARKEVVVVGGVLFRKEVVSEPRRIEVPIVRQGVVVEHYPVDRHPSDRPIETGMTIEVPLLEEHVTIEKRPVVIEEVRVGKSAVQDTRRITETVDREEVVLDAEGSAGVQKHLTDSQTRR